MQLCVGVCAFEGTNTSSSHYRLISAGKNLVLSGIQDDDIVSGTAVNQVGTESCVFRPVGAENT